MKATMQKHIELEKELNAWEQVSDEALLNMERLFVGEKYSRDVEGSQNASSKRVRDNTAGVG